MGMDLRGKGGYFRFSHRAWGTVLKLAWEHGWEPAGTKPPEWAAYAPDGVTVDEVATRAERQRHANWDGIYCSNNHQVVSDEDAANIADALERALDDVPDEGAEDVLLTPAQHQEAYRRGGGCRERS